MGKMIHEKFLAGKSERRRPLEKTWAKRRGYY
jgi:hypothetical protein